MKVSDILISPIITEKALRLVANENKYTFKVNKNASKQQIKETVEKLYKVNVKKINVVNIKGKKKRSWLRRREIKERNWKKAIVELPEGQKILVFEVEEKGGKNE